MRLSTQYLFKQNLDGMTQRMAENQRTSVSLSAGKTLLVASDDPAGAADALLYHHQLATLEMFDGARASARAVMNETDSALSACTGLLTKNLSEKLVNAMNGTLSDADRAVLGQEIAEITRNLLDTVNSRDGSGRYLFSGYKADTPPFDDRGHYQGSDRAPRQTIGEGCEIQTGFTAQEIFMSGSATDLLDNLQQAAVALGSTPTDPDRLKAALASASRAVDAGIDQIGKIRSSLGTRLQQLDALDLQSDNARNATISKLQLAIGGDEKTQISLVSEAKMSEFAMNASMMVFQMMQKMSLFKS